MDDHRQIMIDGDPFIIDDQTTIRELRELAAPSDQHVFVAWDDDQYMLLDPLKNQGDEDEKIVEITENPDEFTFEPTHGRHHHLLVFSEQSRLAGTTITFPDPIHASWDAADEPPFRDAASIGTLFQPSQEE